MTTFFCPSGLVAVVRASTTEACRTVARGLVMAELPAIELTMTVPGVLEVLEELASANVVVGAGTVLDAEVCRACVRAGARFTVSPVSDPAVGEAAHEFGVGYVGGALTPSEVFAAMRMGTDAVKVFPISGVGGPAYLRQLRGPFPELRALASGGVGPADVSAYRAAGAIGVCIGAALVDAKAASVGDVAQVATYARQVLERAGVQGCSGAKKSTG